jgi:AcrR family transcriptional regulator
LQEAALRLFVEHGIDGTGIREIARSAGVSEAALYRHWKSKDDLIRHLYGGHLTEVCRRLDEAIAGQADIVDKLRAAVACAYSLYDEEPLVFRFVMLSAVDLRTALGLGAPRTPIDVVTELCSWAVQQRQAQGDPGQLAAALMGVFLQTALFVLYGRLPGPLSSHAGAVVATCRRILDPPRLDQPSS